MRRDQLEAVLTALHEAGFEYSVSHPDPKHWIVRVWPKKLPKVGPFEVSAVVGSKAARDAILEAALLGYNVGRGS